MLEHLRVDSVPLEYILRRYTKGARQKGTFDRRDFKTQFSDGTSFLYEQNETLQLAMKVARAATRSEEQTARAQVGLEELLQQLDAMNSSTPAGDDAQPDNPCPNINQYEPDRSQFSTTHGNDEQPSYQVDPKYRNMLPPLKSKTKGSGKQKGASKPAGAMKKKKKGKVEYDDEGNPVFGLRKCSVCNKKAGHNARSCPDAKKKRAALQRKGKGPRRRICKGCNKMEGHNSLTCPVLKKKRAKAKAKLKRNLKKNKKQITTSDEEEEEDEEEEDNEEEEEEEEEEEDEHEEDDGEDEDDDDVDDEDDDDDDDDDGEEEEPAPPPSPPTRRTSSRLRGN